MQTNYATNLINDFSNDDRTDVASIMTDLLPTLNATKLVEKDDATNNRAKGGRPKDAPSKKTRCLNVAPTVTTFSNRICEA